MPLTSAKFVPYEMKSSIIKVYSYENKNLCGLLENPFYDSVKYFGNITTLIFLIENLLDEISFPQKSTRTRRFVSESVLSTLKCEYTDEFIGKTPIASFKVSVLFRQNASWQGSIMWLDKGVISEFRSELELMFLIDSVLS